MNFFSTCDQIHSFHRIWSHIWKKSLIENFIFCAVLEMICQNHRSNYQVWLESNMFFNCYYREFLLSKCKEIRNTLVSFFVNYFFALIIDSFWNFESGTLFACLVIRQGAMVGAE